MYTHLHIKYPLLLSDFNENLIFSTDFRKIFEYQISWKSVQWEPNCSMRTDGQTDRAKFNSRLWRFCERASTLTAFFLKTNMSYLQTRHCSARSTPKLQRTHLQLPFPSTLPICFHATPIWNMSGQKLATFSKSEAFFLFSFHRNSFSHFFTWLSHSPTLLLCLTSLILLLPFKRLIKLFLHK